VAKVYIIPLLKAHFLTKKQLEAARRSLDTPAGAISADGRFVLIYSE
jgi:hypothetical protein